MRQVAEALRRVGKESNIPVPWNAMRGAIAPLRGQLGIVLSEPGVGKSAFSLNWAARSQRPSLVLSLDTDLGTQAIRLASILSGSKTEDVKHSPDHWADWLLSQGRWVRMYDLTISSQALPRLVEAEAEYWGSSPDLVVIDNVGNLVREGSYEEHRAVFSDLHRMARTMDTFVLALHHTKRGLRTGDPSLSSGLYGGEQEAEIVLGLNRWSGQAAAPRGVLQVGILKNRSGMADAQGRFSRKLWFDRETMQITDLTQQQVALLAMGGKNMMEDDEDDDQ